MNGGREEGDAICKVCGEWYWFEVGVGGDVHCWPKDKPKLPKSDLTAKDVDKYLGELAARLKKEEP